MAGQMVPGPSTVLTVHPTPIVALYAAIPWFFVAGVCGLCMAIVDLAGILYAVVGGLIFGTLDTLWTYVRLGRNRVVFAPNQIQLVYGFSRPMTIPICPATSMVVRPTTGPLSYVSPAYMGFTSVGVTTSPAQIEVLVKGRHQVRRFERQLVEALRWVQAPADQS